jgi:hypothetical protein
VPDDRCAAELELVTARPVELSRAQRTFGRLLVPPFAFVGLLLVCVAVPFVAAGLLLAAGWRRVCRSRAFSGPLAP